MGSLADPSQQTKHDVFAVCLNEKGFAVMVFALNGLNRANEKISEPNLDRGVNVKLWLLYCDNPIAITEAADHYGNHLRYANADVAWRHDDTLLEVAQCDFRAHL